MALKQLSRLPALLNAWSDIIKNGKKRYKKICVTVPLRRIDWLAMITKLLFIIITWYEGTSAVILLSPTEPG